MLRRIGIDAAQGYPLCRPVPVDDVPLDRFDFLPVLADP